MAISIDWGTKVITVPQADLLQVQASPIEVYELNINDFRLELSNLLDDPLGMSFDDTHTYVPPITVAGVALARTVVIINGYTVTFTPNLSYGVNLVGGNSNIADVVNPNNVSVRSANSAGLQDSESLQASSYNGHVTVDTVLGTPGTTFPRGTEQTPSSNMVDAVAIAESRGISRFFLKSSLTVTDIDFGGKYTFYGDNVSTTLTGDPSSNLDFCSFEDLQLAGDLGGHNRITNCLLHNVSTSHVEAVRCGLIGTVTLDAFGDHLCLFVDCYSSVAGGGPGAYPTISEGGGGSDLAIRNYTGGLRLADITNVASAASVDVISGRVIVDSTVIAGEVTIRGNAVVRDLSTGTAVVDDQTINESVEAGSYGGHVILDAINGTTTADLKYPLGTREFPVNNINDAVAIAAARGLDEIDIVGNYTFTSGDNISFQRIVGQDEALTTLTFEAGVVMAGARFYSSTLQGIFTGAVRYESCNLLDITGASVGPIAGLLTVVDCTFAGTVTLAADLIAEIEVVRCSSTKEGDAIFDMNGADVDAYFTQFSGPVTVRNFTRAGKFIRLHNESGMVTLEASCTAGTVNAYGTCEIVDNSTGTLVLDQTVTVPKIVAPVAANIWAAS